MAIRVIPQRNIRPPVPDADSVWYLLLHLGVPSLHGPPLRRHLNLANRACRRMAIRLAIIPIQSDKHYPPTAHYFFRFPRYRKDDRSAAYIAETILNTVWITCGPIGNPNDNAPALRVPRALVERRLPLRLKDLATLEYSRDWPDRVLWFPHETIGSYTGFSHDSVEAAWNRAPTVLSNASIGRAVRHLRTSLENFHVYPGEIRDVLADPLVTAATPSERTHLETAMQGAFMALEAVIGDPPKDDRRLSAKLRSVGLDPQEEVGYSEKKPLLQVIREFNTARDTKSAHGSTPESTITALEVLEFQSCAMYILDMALEPARPEMSPAPRGIAAA